MVQNLGKYERQAWQAGEFGGGGAGADGAAPLPAPEEAAARQRAYTRFLLQLYGARPLNGYTWLHGVRAGRMVHVATVDAPVTPGDVTNIVVEFKRAVGTGENATMLTGVLWQYLKVPQKDFEQLQPTEFADLIAL